MSYTMRSTTSLLDPSDACVVSSIGESSLLGIFNRAGVLAPLDIHVALCLGRLGNESNEEVLLAAALAVRAPRVGHVRADLASVQATVVDDAELGTDLDSLPWPEIEGWIRAVQASPIVEVGEAWLSASQTAMPAGQAAAVRPLRLIETSLYLERYWRDERAVAADILERAASEAAVASPELIETILERLFPASVRVNAQGLQRRAVQVAAHRRLAVVAGGPGTGKTTTIARLVALLIEAARSSGVRRPLIALVAPTGKAAARMEEAVHSEARCLEVHEEVRAHLLGLHGSTIHRLLGAMQRDAGGFRYDARNRLPHDVVVVDETSMAALWLVARLAEALRPDARLVLVGDPRQLASVEAGAVLDDIVGPEGDGATGASLELATDFSQGEVGQGEVGQGGVGQGEVAQGEVAQGRVGGAAPPLPAVASSVVVLGHNYRFSGGLARLAEAVRVGDADTVLDQLTAGSDYLAWIPFEATADMEVASAVAERAGAGEQLAQLRSLVVGWGTALLEAAHQGDRETALAVAGRLRLLCAHRRGPAGAGTWNRLVESWLAQELPWFSPEEGWYVGRPVLVTANDYSLRLYNGDSGVTVSRGEGLEVVFDRPGGSVRISPARLQAVETVFAITVHKAQGSEFDDVAVVLPDPSSRVLTRELLYTALTRARRRVVLAGSEESLRAALARPVARSSGLRQRLWGSAGESGGAAGESEGAAGESEGAAGESGGAAGESGAEGATS